MATAVERTIHRLNGDLPLYKRETTLKENMQMGSVFERIAVTFGRFVRAAGAGAGRGGNLWRGVVYDKAYERMKRYPHRARSWKVAPSCAYVLRQGLILTGCRVRLSG